MKLIIETGTAGSDAVTMRVAGSGETPARASVQKVRAAAKIGRPAKPVAAAKRAAAAPVATFRAASKAV